MTRDSSADPGAVLSFRARRHGTVLLVGLMLFMMAALVFHRLVWDGWVLHAGDVWMQYYPARAYTYAFLRAGHLPLWTPNLSFGYPLFAEAQAGMLYPVHLALLPFSTSTAYGLSVIIRYILAGTFMFLYVRRLTGHPWAAALSSLTFAFSGYMIAQVPHENVENALLWLPLILLLLDKWRAEQNRRALLGAGLCMGVSFLAGYFYMALLVLLAALLYGLYFGALLHRDRRQGWRGPLLRRWSGGLAAFGLLAVGLGCVQLLPGYELAQESIRAGGIDYNVSTQVSFPPPYLLCFIFPKFFGHPADTRWDWGLWKGNRIDLVVYLGVLPLLLVLAALLIRRDRHTAFFGLMLFAALSLAFGQFSPLWHLWNQLPVVSMMRNPARFLGLAVTAGAVLAGLGLDTLLRFSAADQQRRRRFMRGIGCGAAILLGLGLTGGWLISSFRPTIIGAGHWFVDRFVYSQSIHQHPKDYYYDQIDHEFSCLAAITRLDHPFFYPSLILLCAGALLVLYLARGQRAPKTAGPLVLALTALDLLWFARNYNYEMPPEVYQQKPEYIAFMEQDAGLFRYAFAPLEVGVRNYDPLLFGQMYIQGKTPLQIKRHVDLVETLRPRMDTLVGAAAPSPLLNLLNIKYIINVDSLTHDWVCLRFNEGIKIYENKTALPRAFVAPHARILPSPGDVLQALTDPTFTPRDTVLLEESPPMPAGREPAEARPDTAAIVAYEAMRVAVEVETKGGFLVLTDTFYPGWRAYVNGVERPILRADYLFRAVPLEPGRHRVEFVYRPRSFTVGAGISLLTLGIVMLLFFFPRKSAV